jgi:tetratricopeptide (TPR) repeat protein
MMTEPHYDEEVLIALLEEGDDALGRDPHIAACATCTTTLASVREIADCLKSPGVWDATEISETPNANVLATLRNAQGGMRSEDAAAEEWLRQLIAKPRESWTPTLHAHPEWRTAGMVRRLIAATDGVIKTTPPDALEITTLAVEIVEGLEAARYGESTVARLRGHAWRERAYALYFTGSYTEAVWAVERSRNAFASCGASEFDDARSAVVFALVCAEQEKFMESLAAAHQAVEVFARYGSRMKLVAAKRSEASILYALRRYREALSIYRGLEAESLSAEERAGICQNIAVCYQELGDFDAAGRYFTVAIEAASKLGLLTVIARARWQFALVLLAQGRSAQGLELLRQVRDDFEASNMAHDVAEVTTEIAHALVVAGRMSEVADECRQALAYFVAAGLSMTEPAMSAISLLREAAAAGRLDERAVAEIRTTVVNARRLQLHVD